MASSGRNTPLAPAPIAFVEPAGAAVTVTGGVLGDDEAGAEDDAGGVIVPGFVTGG